jgi:hypothetical protein
MKKLLKKIELWIDIHLVYFLYNGNKTQRYYDMLEKKWNLEKQNIIQIDLSGCKNWNECMKVIELVTSGKVKIKVNE